MTSKQSKLNLYHKSNLWVVYLEHIIIYRPLNFDVEKYQIIQQNLGLWKNHV